MLKVWLPLNGNLNNLGQATTTIVNSGSTSGSGYYAFDGSDDFISLADVGQYFTGQDKPFSICFWFRTLSSSKRGIFFGNFSLPNCGLGFNVEVTSANQLRFYWGGSPDYYVTSVTTGLWTHVVFMYTGTRVLIYQNGVQLRSDSVVLRANNATGLFYIGRDSRTGDTAFHGQMSDFRIYDHALSNQEIYELSKGLLAHYKLDDPYVEGTTNLVTGVSSVNARLEKYKNGIKFLVINSDAYCGLSLKETLKTGKTYTLSYNVNNLSNSDTLGMGFYYNSRMNHTIMCHNGLNTVTFSPTLDLTSVTFDDQGKSLTQFVYLTNIQIEEKPHNTPYTPSVRTGHKIKDYSGFGNDLAISGEFTMQDSSPRYLQSTVFSGTAYAFGSIKYRQLQSVSLWVYIGEQIPTSSEIIFAHHDSGLALGFYNSQILACCNSAKTAKYSSASCLKNAWNHFVITLPTSGSTAVYLNGVQLTGAVSDCWTTSQNGFYLGRRHSGTPYYGAISDVRLYSTVLSQTDALTLYNEAAQFDSTNRIHLYELNEDYTHEVNNLNKRGTFNMLNFSEDDIIDISATEVKSKEILEI